MEHIIVLREEDRYNAFPTLHQIPDGRLSIGCVSSPVGDHIAMGDWAVFVSDNNGYGWERSDDLTLRETSGSISEFPRLTSALFGNGSICNPHACSIRLPRHWECPPVRSGRKAISATPFCRILHQ